MEKGFKLSNIFKRSESNKSEGAEIKSKDTETDANGVINIPDRLQRAESFYNVNLETMKENPDIEKFIQIIKKLKTLLERQSLLEQRSELMVGYLNSMKDHYPDEQIKSILIKATDEDLKSIPVFYLALIDEAFRRGIYGEKPKLE